MSEIKAVGKLREQAEREPLALTYILNDIADEIEAEITANYMRLPVDADGVPIHVGDAITLPNGSRDKVCFITIREHDTVFNERGWVPSQCTHVKPRTLEDVLNEFGIAAARELNADPYGYGISDKTIAKCVSEIRELLGGEGGGDDFQM